MVYIFFCFIQPAFSQNQTKWRLKNRLQTSFETDDNILESPKSVDSLIVGDRSLRLLFESKASYFSRKSRLRLAYTGGLQRYFDNAVENKLINEIEGSATRVLGLYAVGLRASGRLKIYLNRTLDYSNGSIEAFLKLPPLARFGNEFSIARAGLDYQDSDDFDISELIFSWAVSRKLSPHLSFLLKPGLIVRQYSQREAFVFQGLDNAIFLDRNQEDSDYQVLLRMQYTKSFLVSLSYLLQHNDSNSDIFIFTKNQMTLAWAVPLPGRTWLRGYAAVQLKNYANQSPAVPVTADPERNESNFLILDLSKDLTNNLTGLIRFAHYNNESIIRDRFYRKNLFNVGFDFRF